MNISSNLNLYNKSNKPIVSKDQTNINKNNVAFKGQVISHTADITAQLVTGIGGHVLGVPGPAAHRAMHNIHESFRPVHEAAREFDKGLVEEAKSAAKSIGEALTKPGTRGTYF